MSEIAGYELEVPLGPSAGVLFGDDEATFTKQTIGVLRSDAGLAWIGPFTKEAQIKPYGMNYTSSFAYLSRPNIGYEAARKLFPQIKEEADEHGKPVIVCIAIGPGEDPETVLPEMAAGFEEEGATFIEYDCSSISGLKSGDNETLLGYQFVPHDDDEVGPFARVDRAICESVSDNVSISRTLPAYLSDTNNLTVDKQRLGRAISIINKCERRSYINVSHLGPSAAVLDRRTLNIDFEFDDEVVDYSVKAGKTSVSMLLDRAGEIGESQTVAAVRACSYDEVNIEVLSTLGIRDGTMAFVREQIGAVAMGGRNVYLRNLEQGISLAETSNMLAAAYKRAMISN